MVCDVLGNFKPGDDRKYAQYQMKQDRRFGYLIVNTATERLCPEMDTT